MNKSITEHIDLFDSYQNNSLSAQEKLDFEQKLKTDTNFDESFALYKKSLHIIEKEGIRQEMAEIIQNQKKENSKWIYAIAASITLLLVVGYFLYPTNNKDLYARYFESYPNILVRRSESVSIPGMEEYSDQKWEIAKSKLMELPNKNDTIHFYLALSTMNTKKWEKSVFYFKKMPSHSIFHQQKKWYLALSYIKIGQRNEAKKILQSIKPDEFMHSESVLLIDELE